MIIVSLECCGVTWRQSRSVFWKQVVLTLQCVIASLLLTPSYTLGFIAALKMQEWELFHLCRSKLLEILLIKSQNFLFQLKIRVFAVYVGKESKVVHNISGRDKILEQALFALELFLSLFFSYGCRMLGVLFSGSFFHCYLTRKESVSVRRSTGIIECSVCVLLYVWQKDSL